MKLKDIIKEIAKNKDQFSKLNESKSNPKLESIVKDIVNQYLAEINEGNQQPNFKKTDPRELAATYKYLIRQAVEDLEKNFNFKFEEQQKNFIAMWLADYTSMLIQQLSKRDINPVALTPRF
jgi:GTP cyclohydrolase I